MGGKPPPTWPRITKAFEALTEKLEEIERDPKGSPDWQLATIDTWIGWLFLERAAIEVGRETKPPRTAKRG